MRCTYKNGKWYDKETGEEVTLPDRGDSWKGTFQIIRDIDGYDCPVTGKWVGSRREHHENLKRRGCRLLEPGEKREALKDRERNARETLDRSVRSAIESIAHQID